MLWDSRVSTNLVDNYEIHVILAINLIVIGPRRRRVSPLKGAICRYFSRDVYFKMRLMAFQLSS